MLPTYYMYLIIQRADRSVGACGGWMWEETIKVERSLPFQSIPSTRRRHKVLSLLPSFQHQHPPFHLSSQPAQYLWTSICDTDLIFATQASGPLRGPPASRFKVACRTSRVAQKGQRRVAVRGWLFWTRHILGFGLFEAKTWEGGGIVKLESCAVQAVKSSLRSRDLVLRSPSSTQRLDNGLDER